MTRNEFLELVGELEGPVGQLTRAFKDYALAPSQETASELEAVGELYERASESLGAELMPRLQEGPDPQEGKDPDAAALLVGLVGLDMGVAANASAVSALVQEPDELIESERPPQLNRVTEQEFQAVVRVDLIEIYRSLWEIQPEDEPWDDAPVGRGNPHFSVDEEVNAVVSQTADDMVDVLGAGVQFGVGPLGTVVLNHLPTHALIASIGHVAPKLIKWWQVCRRLARRGWTWVASKLSGLLGDTLVATFEETLSSMIEKHLKEPVRSLLDDRLDVAQVKENCDALVNRNDGRDEDRVRAARDAVRRHENTRKWISLVTLGLGPLATAGFAIGPAGSLSIAILLAVTLLLVSYVLAHDFLDSNARPCPPDLFKGIQRAVA